MTVIVGILCSDGVVIGTDSAMLAGRSSTGYTIERQDGDVLKIEVIENTITAVTGAMGLAQRFNDQVATTLKELQQPFQPPQQFVPGYGYLGSVAQRRLVDKIPAGKIPFDLINEVEMGQIISEVAIDDFKRTTSISQANPQIGWGLGALLAFAKDGRPQLIDFDPNSFHPELRGHPDASRQQDRNWRCVSWGAGARLADPFLAHAYRLLFNQQVPTLSGAKLVVAWTIKHACMYTPGWVGGDLQLALLENVDSKWSAHHADKDDIGEIEEQVSNLETYISDFHKKQTPDENTFDLKKELDLDGELKVGKKGA